MPNMVTRTIMYLEITIMRGNQLKDMKNLFHLTHSLWLKHPTNKTNNTVTAPMPNLTQSQISWIMLIALMENLKDSWATSNPWLITTLNSKTSMPPMSTLLMYSTTSWNKTHVSTAKFQISPFTSIAQLIITDQT